LLNLSAKAIDRLAASPALRAFDPARIAPALMGRQRNLAYMSVWAAVFLSLHAIRAIGDQHPGQWVPFWQQACDDGRAYACPYLADLEQGLCNQGSPWACNEAGLMHIALARSGEDLRRGDPRGASVPFRRACELGLETACRNLTTVASGLDHFSPSRPTVADYPVLLRGSKGEIRDTNPIVLLKVACQQGWPNTCPH
jgi:hypothetical protein